MKGYFVRFLIILVSVIIIPAAAEATGKGKKIPSVEISEEESIYSIDIEELAVRIMKSFDTEALNDEALNAFAISARSIGAYASFFGLKHEDFSFCSDSKCCYSLASAENTGDEDSRIKAAVDSTKGLILTSDNLPALALFTQCNGSGSESNSDFTYLTPTPEKQKCDIHNYKIPIENEIFNGIEPENIATVYNGNILDIAIINGDKYSGFELMQMLGLPSREISFIYSDGKLYAECNGLGNSYGLNLCAASKSEDSYEQILKTYFPKLDLSRIY